MPMQQPRAPYSSFQILTPFVYRPQPAAKACMSRDLRSGALSLLKLVAKAELPPGSADAVLSLCLIHRSNSLQHHGAQNTEETLQYQSRRELLQWLTLGPLLASQLLQARAARAALLQLPATEPNNEYYLVKQLPFHSHGRPARVSCSN